MVSTVLLVLLSTIGWLYKSPLGKDLDSGYDNWNTSVVICTTDISQLSSMSYIKFKEMSSAKQIGNVVADIMFIY